MQQRCDTATPHDKENAAEISRDVNDQKFLNGKLDKNYLLIFVKNLALQISQENCHSSVNSFCNKTQLVSVFHSVCQKCRVSGEKMTCLLPIYPAELKCHSFYVFWWCNFDQNLTINILLKIIAWLIVNWRIPQINRDAILYQPAALKHVYKVLSWATWAHRVALISVLCSSQPEANDTMDIWLLYCVSCPYTCQLSLVLILPITEGCQAKLTYMGII